MEQNLIDMLNNCSGIETETLINTNQLQVNKIYKINNISVKNVKTNNIGKSILLNLEGGFKYWLPTKFSRIIEELNLINAYKVNINMVYLGRDEFNSPNFKFSLCE